MLIAYLSGDEPISPMAKHVVDVWVERGRNEAVVSMVSVMEILVRPLRTVPSESQSVLDFLRYFPHLHLMPVGLQVAQEAAALRAAYRFAPPDALTIGTGLAAQVGHILTNDARWKRLKPVDRRVKVVSMKEYLPFP